MSESNNVSVESNYFQLNKVYIEKLLESYRENDELEIRLGFFSYDSFRASTGKKMFLRFIKLFDNTDFKKEIKYQLIHMYNNRIKKIKDIGITNDNGKLKTIITEENVKKCVKYILDFKEKNIRIALNQEFNLDKEPEGKCYYKYRTRVTFTKPDFSYKVDLSVDKNCTDNVNYQIEIEFLKKPLIDEIINILMFIDSIVEEN